MSFCVHFDDDTTTVVHDADSYEQEGPLTTFFDRNGGGRLASAFAVRVASFRTNKIVEVRRTDARSRHRLRASTSPERSVVVDQVVLVDDDVPALVAVAAEVDEHVARLEDLSGSGSCARTRGAAALHAVDVLGDRHATSPHSRQRAVGVGPPGAEEREELEPVAALIEVEVGDEHRRLPSRGACTSTRPYGSLMNDEP